MKPGQKFRPYKKFRGFVIPNYLARSGLLSPIQLLIYGRLAQFAGKNGQCWCSYQTLADELGLNRRTVVLNFKKLVELGFVKREERPGQTTLFHFLWHEIFEKEDTAHQGEPGERGSPGRNNLVSEAHQGGGERGSPGGGERGSPGGGERGSPRRESRREKRRESIESAKSSPSSFEGRGEDLPKRKTPIERRQAEIDNLHAKITEYTERLHKEEDKNTVELLRRQIKMDRNRLKELDPVADKCFESPRPPPNPHQY